MRGDWTQRLMYMSVAGASVSLAFFVALRFVGHAKAQTPVPATPAAASAPAPATPAKNPPVAAPKASAAPAPNASAEATAAPETPAPAAAEAGQTSEGEGEEAKDEHAAGVTAAESADINKLEGFLEPFIYDVVNRRDPFQPFAEYVPPDTGIQGRALSPAQRYDLDQLHLIGVMWDIKEPKAMFMDPDSEIITLGRDEGIGNKNGYIAAIREGEVVVVEAIRKRGDVVYKTRVLHLER